MSKKNRFPIFSERFSSLRGDRTQAEFADFLDISRQTVSFYENGERIPDALALRDIALKCKVTSDWLLGLSDVRPLDIDTKQKIQDIQLDAPMATEKLNPPSYHGSRLRPLAYVLQGTSCLLRVDLEHEKVSIEPVDRMSGFKIVDLPNIVQDIIDLSNDPGVIEAMT